MSPFRQEKISALTLMALGVVFGDIGTSPLYTMKEIFFVGSHPLSVNAENIFGILSLITWALIMVVSVKYITFIIRADNHGEGGVMALLALASNALKHKPKQRYVVMCLGILGTCMFYADGMITPAISVLSAVEGLDVVAPSLEVVVVPITLVVLFTLFLVQRKGTSAVGIFFGPIMLLWFISLSLLGIYSIVQHPDILRALDPIYAWNFFYDSPLLGFVLLGSILLAVTGAEALYADMGHFGRTPITIAWFSLVFPALLLNYFGQGALILHDASAISNPFYLLAPSWLVLPLVCLATIATVIASQAVITGAFSISRQAIHLGYLPRMRIQHTSESTEGQIYMPRINFILMLAVMLLVIGFDSSVNLAAAYGVAVASNMFITTLLATVVFYYVWHWSKTKILLLTTIFISIDLAFFGATLFKIPYGGWVPISIGALLFIIMLAWRTGRSLLYARLEARSMLLGDFIKALDKAPPLRVAGTAIFMTPSVDHIPPALSHYLQRSKVLHERVILLTVHFLNVPYTKETAHVPYTTEEERIEVKVLPHNFYQIVLHYGFKDQPDITKDMQLSKRYGLEIDLQDATFFVSKEMLIANVIPTMALWRKHIFIYLFHTTETISNQFKLPVDHVVEFGTRVSF